MTFTVLVLAKAPRPGVSKTRLVPRYGPEGAADLAAAALEDTLDAVRRVPADRHVLVLAGRLTHGHLEELHRNRFDIVPQRSGSHAERIIGAFECTGGAAVLVGMDTPQLDPGVLSLDLAAPVDAWLGPADDGGWWAMGLRHARRDARRVLAGVPMSTAATGAVQSGRLALAGLRTAELPGLRDVDEPADALAVAACAPHTRFAQRLAQLELGLEAGVGVA
jgi:hypothetical protein